MGTDAQNTVRRKVYKVIPYFGRRDAQTVSNSYEKGAINLNSAHLQRIGV